MPPHCGNIGPWWPSELPGADEVVAPGLLSPESEQPATDEIRIIAEAAKASAVGLRRTATLLCLRLLLVHTMHCSGSPTGQPPTRHLSRHFNAFAGGARNMEPSGGARGRGAGDVRQLPNAPGTAAPVHPALPPAGRGADGASADQHPGVAVPADSQCRHHR